MGAYEDAIRAYYAAQNISEFHLMECDCVLMRTMATGFGPMELLNFALCSKFMRSVMKQYKKEIEYLWINIRENGCVFEIKLLGRGEVFWRIKSTRDVLDDVQSIESDYTELDNLKMENKRQRRAHNDKYVIYSYCEEDLAMCMKIVEVMLDVWIPKNLNFYISKPHNISYLLNNDRLNHYDSLTFIVYFEVSDEEFRLFREKIQPKKDLCFNFIGNKNQNHGSMVPFNCDKLEICSAEWMNRDDLFNIDCRLLHLKETRLLVEDWNAYFKQWLSGNDTKLESMKVTTTECDGDEVLDGLETHTLEQIREFLNVANCNFEFRDVDDFKYPGSNGHHFIRHDGKIATLYIQSRQWTDDKLYFHIWNDSNPKRISMELSPGDVFNQENF